jgi:hypothetical protein
MSLRLSVIRVALGAGFLLPSFANAQYAEVFKEHDWTVVVADHRFGLEQSALTPGDIRWTRIYWGFGTTTTNWRAPTIALVAGGSLIALLIGGALIFTRGSSSSGKRSRDE